MLRLASGLEAADRRRAQTVLATLLQNGDGRVRAEARFRLAGMAERAGDLAGAERWYRALLDEQPSAANARLELGRVLAEQRKLGAAARELRRAHASGLPPEVAKTVERIVSLLRHDAPFGGSMELAFAPDSNVNRATRAQTVTALGLPFELNDDARARSGVGVAYAGQVFMRRPLGQHRFGIALAAQGNRYRDKAVSDLTMSVSAGPQFRLGDAQLSAGVAASRGWLGGQLITTDLGVEGKARLPLNGRTALAIGAAITDERNHRNPAGNGTIISTQAAVETALSARLYARATASATRIDARAGTLSSWSYGGGFTLSRQFGGLTGYAGVEARHVQGDEPFFLFGRARSDTLVQGSLGLIVRPLTIGGFAPVVRVTHARSSSPIEIYGYKRTRAEFGITRDF